MKHSEITREIIGGFFAVFNELGAGFLESVYVESLAIALSQMGLPVAREQSLTVHFRGEIVGKFRADLIVGEVILVEVKACSKLNSVHEAQTLNYLRATSLEVGLLVNFGFRPQFKRLLYDNPRKFCQTHNVVGAGSCSQ